MHDLSTTLVAVATPPGRGGIACLRISGPQAVTFARRLFRPRSPERTAEMGGAPCFGWFLGRDGHPLDHGYLVLFAAGNSYTGEPTAELWTHGSPAVMAELVNAAVAAGSVPAEPGEFTYRALAHGRLDLARAEAVRDLIQSRTLYQARVAFAQAEGALSARLAPLREMLEEWIARGEAAVEFVDESETHLPAGRLAAAIEAASACCVELLSGYLRGRLVREGATLVMIGLPNVGKSSLFNRLLARERAIVTEVPGTTRDTIEEELDLGGIPVRLVDTAGLRDVSDPVESEGVRRAHRARDEADLVMLVLDGSRPFARLEMEALDAAAAGAEGARTVVVVNKTDLPQAAGGMLHRNIVRVSAVTGAGIDDLIEELRGRLIGVGSLETPIITNSRHANALEEVHAALERAKQAVEAGLSEELVLEDLREAMRQLGIITGQFGNDELYARIFSTFCIGK